MHDAVTAMVQAFRSAPLEADGWDTALKELARRTRSSRSNLVEVSNGAFAFNWVTDIPPGFHEGLGAIGGGSPEVNWRIASTAAPLQVVSERHYAETRKRLKTRDYDDYSESVESPFGCQAVLNHTPKTFHGLAVLRSRADGVTSERDRAVFAAAAPHVIAALRMQQAIERQGAVLLAGTLEAMTAAAFLCDAEGRVAALTAAAETVLREGCVMRLRDHRLSALRPAEDQRLQRAIRGALQDAPGAAGSAQVWLSGRDGPATGSLCEIFALPRREWTCGFGARAVIVVRAQDSLRGRHGKLLRDMFDLTEAEADVAAMAADGLSREQIAARRGSSVSTVRAQFKSIFAKAGIGREAELVALINRLLR